MDERALIDEIRRRFRQETGLDMDAAEMTFFSGRATHPDWRFCRDIASFKMQLKRKYAEIASNPEAYLLEGGMRTEVEIATYESPKRTLRRFTADDDGRVRIRPADARAEIFRGCRPDQARGHAFDDVVSNILMSDHHLDGEDYTIAMAKYVQRAFGGASLAHAPESDGRLLVQQFANMDRPARREMLRRIFAVQLVGDADDLGVDRAALARRRVDHYERLLDVAVSVRARRQDFATPEAQAEVFGEMARSLAAADGVDIAADHAARDACVARARRTWETSCRKLMADMAVATAPQRMLEWLRPATADELTAMRRRLKRENPSRGGEIDALDTRRLQAARKASAFWSLKEALVHVPDDRYRQLVDVVKRGLMTHEAGQVQDLLTIARIERQMRSARAEKLANARFYDHALEQARGAAGRLASKARHFDERVQSGEYSYGRMAKWLVAETVRDVRRSFGIETADALCKVATDRRLRDADPGPESGLQAEVVLQNAQSVLTLARAYQQNAHLPPDELAWEMAKMSMLEAAQRSRFFCRFQGGLAAAGGDWKAIAPELAQAASRRLLATVFEKTVVDRIVAQSFGAPVTVAMMVHLAVDIAGHWALDPLADNVENRIYQGFEVEESSWLDLGIRARNRPMVEGKFDSILQFVPLTLSPEDPGWVPPEERAFREDLLLQLSDLLERAIEAGHLSREPGTIRMAGREVEVHPYGDLKAFERRQLAEPPLPEPPQAGVPLDVDTARTVFELRRANMWSYFETRIRRLAAGMVASTCGGDPSQAAVEFPLSFETARRAVVYGGHYDLLDKYIDPQTAFFQRYAHNYLAARGPFEHATPPVKTGGIARDQMGRRLAARLQADYARGYAAWMRDEALWEQAKQLWDLFNAMDVHRHARAIGDDWTAVIAEAASSAGRPLGPADQMRAMAAMWAERGVTRPAPRVRLMATAVLPDAHTRTAGDGATDPLCGLDVQVVVDAQDDLFPLPWTYDWRVNAGGSELAHVFTRPQEARPQRFAVPDADGRTEVEGLVYPEGGGTRAPAFAGPAGKDGDWQVEVTVYASRPDAPGTRGREIGRSSLTWSPPLPTETAPAQMYLADLGRDGRHEVPGERLDAPGQGEPLCIVYPFEVRSSPARSFRLDIGRLERASGGDDQTPAFFEVATSDGRRLDFRPAEDALVPGRYLAYAPFTRGLETGRYRFELGAEWQSDDGTVRVPPSMLTFRVVSRPGLRLVRVEREEVGGGVRVAGERIDGGSVRLVLAAPGPARAELTLRFPDVLPFDRAAAIPATLRGLTPNTRATVTCRAGSCAQSALTNPRQRVTPEAAVASARFEERVDQTALAGQADPVVRTRVTFALGGAGSVPLVALYTRDGTAPPPAPSPWDVAAGVAEGRTTAEPDRAPDPVIRGVSEPEPEADPAPPAPTGGDGTGFDRFLGRWVGRARVVEAESSDPDVDVRQAIGRSVPADFRVVRHDGRYQIQITQVGADKPRWPAYLPIRLEDDALMASYDGPAIDDQGHVHRNMRVRAALRFKVRGRQGRGVLGHAMTVDGSRVRMKIGFDVSRR